MTGTPWHPEVLGRSEGDDRRHRSRCIHFKKENKSCMAKSRKCIGSAHCDKYQEETWYNYDAVSGDTKTIPQKKDNSQVSNKKYKAGDIVSHFKYGCGRIENIKNDTITVTFDSVGQKLLSASYVADKNILKLG